MKAETCRLWKKWIKIWLVGLSICTSGIVSAGTWSNYTKVNSVYVYSDGSLYPTFAEMINPEGCPNVAYILVDSGNAAVDKIYSMLLAASASGQQVKYYVSGCVNNYPQLLHIKIKPLSQ